MPSVIETLTEKARRLRTDAHALHLAYRDPRTPWYARLCAGLVLAYAVSPIDLIPDFIPILGYLDDILLIPLGTVFCVRLIPPKVMQAAKRSVKITDL